MTHRNYDFGRLGLLGAVALLSAGCVALGQNEPSAAQDVSAAELQRAGREAALLILPVRVLGKPDRNVADALGLVLEKSGMPNLAATDTAFAPPADTPWENVPALLAAHLKANPIAEAFVLYGEYLGDPRSGPSEVRFVVCAADGKVMLSDRQTPKDAEFKRTAGRDPDPMGCSVLVAERVFKLCRWSKQPPAGEGRFARLWAEKSGTPGRDEQKAMGERRAALQAGLSGASIAVIPTVLGDKRDSASAARLAKLIAAELKCKATFVERPLAATPKPTSNEQKRLWDLARALCAHVGAGGFDAQYVLVAEIGVSPANPSRGYVHVVLCDGSGQPVVVDFCNDQHDDYRRAAPKSTEDGEKLAAARLARAVRSHE
ncbi:MAG: hypothetical protein CHACPFDD_03261 [Phycisphaerae bacterium]|nr:hypothetical protein [Phycisphaerae bacterium]